MKAKFLSLVFLLLSSLSFSQVNLLIPCLTTTQRDSIPTTVGLEIFNLDNNCIQVYNNEGWHTMWCYDCTGDVLSGIVSQPEDTAVCPGDDAVFEVESSIPVSYQWLACPPGGAWSDIPGAVANQLSILNVQPSDDSTQYRCLLRDFCGFSVYSDSALLTVYRLPLITVDPLDTLINAGDGASFSVTATGEGLTYQWQENNGGSWSDISDGGSNPAYSGSATATLLLASVPESYDNYAYRCVTSGICPPADTSNAAILSVTGSSPQYPAGSVFCIPGGTAVVEVVSGIGRVWMDRNLGSSQAATASDDYLAYGSLYQWGRFSDGHQCINWTSSTGSDGEEQNHETTVLSTSDDPGHGDFILNGSSPYDWRTPENDSLWQGLSCINNPCPSGYRLPTSTELEAEKDSWGVGNYNSAGAYASPLKLPVAGYRHPVFDGFIYTAGNSGEYWSSTTITPPSSSTIVLYFVSYFASASNVNSYRAYGLSVRCIKD